MKNAKLSISSVYTGKLLFVFFAIHPKLPTIERIEKGSIGK